MPPLPTKVEFCRLYPKKLNYLFLAVFAFSEAFCYAKTAFSYSRALLSPCTPVLFMVKDVVKSEYRMIDMWSCFRGGRSARKRSAGREEKHIEDRRSTPISTCGLSDKKQRNYVVRHRSNYMVKLCDRSRELHIIPSSAGVVL